MFRQIILLILIVAGIALLGFLLYTRLSTDPIAFLVGFIGLAAAVVFWLQFLKDW